MMGTFQAGSVHALTPSIKAYYSLIKSFEGLYLKAYQYGTDVLYNVYFIA